MTIYGNYSNPYQNPFELNPTGNSNSNMPLNGFNGLPYNPLGAYEDVIRYHQMYGGAQQPFQNYGNGGYSPFNTPFNPFALNQPTAQNDSLLNTFMRYLRYWMFPGNEAPKTEPEVNYMDGVYSMGTDGNAIDREVSDFIGEGGLTLEDFEDKLDDVESRLGSYKIRGEEPPAELVREFELALLIEKVFKALEEYGDPVTGEPIDENFVLDFDYLQDNVDLKRDFGLSAADLVEFKAEARRVYEARIEAEENDEYLRSRWTDDTDMKAAYDPDYIQTVFGVDYTIENNQWVYSDNSLVFKSKQDLLDRADELREMALYADFQEEATELFHAANAAQMLADHWDDIDDHLMGLVDDGGFSYDDIRAVDNNGNGDDLKEYQSRGSDQEDEIGWRDIQKFNEYMNSH